MKPQSINLNHPGFQDSVGEFGYEQHGQKRKLFVTLKRADEKETIERIFNKFFELINDGVIDQDRGTETIKDILYDIELQHRVGVP